MVLLYVASDEIGHGESELGKILMPAYLNAFSKSDKMPDVIVFVNSGVKLLTADSSALTALQNLEAKGVKLLACGTCLDYYNLKDKLAVGGPTNAVEITSMMMQADKVIKV
jgi:selenium metabolism protein YedF